MNETEVAKGQLKKSFDLANIVVREGEHIAAVVLNIDQFYVNEPDDVSYKLSWWLASRDAKAISSASSKSGYHDDDITADSFEMRDSTPYVSVKNQVVNFGCTFRIPVALIPTHPCPRQLERSVTFVLNRKQNKTDDGVAIAKKKWSIYFMERQKFKQFEITFDSPSTPEISRRLVGGVLTKMNLEAMSFESWCGPQSPAREAQIVKLVFPTFLYVKPESTLQPGKPKPPVVQLPPSSPVSTQNPRISTCPRCTQPFDIQDNDEYSCYAHSGAPVVHWSLVGRNVALGFTGGGLIGVGAGATVGAVWGFKASILSSAMVSKSAAVKDVVNGATVLGTVGGTVGGCTGGALGSLTQSMSPLRYSCCGRSLENPVCGTPRPHIVPTVDLLKSQNLKRTSLESEASVMSSVPSVRPGGR